MAERARNTRPRTVTGYKGVEFIPKTGRYRARAYFNGKPHHAGMYPSAEEAARAVDEKLRELGATDALYNFPEPGERSIDTSPYIEQGVGKVPLSRGLVALVDTQDTKRVSEHIWHAYTQQGRTYACTTIDGRKVALHRFLLGVKQVMHRNGDRLDCRRANLVPAGLEEAPDAPTSRSSRYRGVYRAKRGKWRAVACGRHLGTFATEEEAYDAYLLAVAE